MKYILIIFCILKTSSLFAQINIKDIQSIIEKNIQIPETEFKPISFEMPQGNVTTVLVYSEDDFKKVDYSKITLFDVQCDIQLSKTVGFYSDKGIIIKGNGHKIYQFSENNRKLIKKGIDTVSEYKESIKGTEVFTNAKGKLFKLSKSPVYQALSWKYDKTSNKISIQLPNECKSWNFNETDQVYISYEIWFTRQRDKVISAKNGILTFKTANRYKPEGIFLDYTPKPFFYLENMTQTNEGVLIKNGKMRHASKHGKLSQCKLQSLFFIGKQTLFDCYDISFGASLECMVNNAGTARFQNCRFESTEANGIRTYNKLIVKNCHFEHITKNAIVAQPKSHTSITYSTFEKIGEYGFNTACINAMGNVYAAYNHFKDFNYSAFILGNISTVHKEELPISLIEHNRLYWSKEWQKKMKTLGLSDGGAIYIGTNNKRCTIRFNSIHNFGGHGSNRGIFCDDGAYNVTIYGNIISGTANSYDIDSRDCTNITYRKTPQGYHFNTNNFIGYNICEKSMKAEGNSRIKENNCHFIQNIITGEEHKNPANIIKNNMSGQEQTTNKHQNGIVFDLKGKFDANGKYYPSINISEIWNP